MAREHRTRLSPEERRAQLVASGVAFLATNPLDELTLEVLAERVGVSRGLLFHYFGSRQGMHREIVRTAAAGLLEASAPNLDQAPPERMRDTLLRLVAFVREHRGTFYSLVRGVASGDPVVRVEVDRARDTTAGWILDALLELGIDDSPLLRLAMRAWVSFAEEVFVEMALDTDAAPDEIVSFLARSAFGVVHAVRGETSGAGQ